MSDTRTEQPAVAVAQALMRTCYDEANRIANHCSDGAAKWAMRNLYDAANEAKARLAGAAPSHEAGETNAESVREQRLGRELDADFERRLAEMDIHELRSRVLTQRDYLRRWASCVDGLPLPDTCGTIDGCRLPRDVTRIVERILAKLPTDAESSNCAR